jgi:hypothetical protein
MHPKNRRKNMFKLLEWLLKLVEMSRVLAEAERNTKIATVTVW